MKTLTIIFLLLVLASCDSTARQSADRSDPRTRCTIETYDICRPIIGNNEAFSTCLHYWIGLTCDGVRPPPPRDEPLWNHGGSWPL
jgi:hypothetical protein